MEDGHSSAEVVGRFVPWRGARTAPHGPARPFWIVAAAALAATALSVGASSGHLSRPVVAGLYWAYLTAVPILIGVVWLHRRPVSTTGWWLIALGVSYAMLSLQGSDSPIPYVIGVLGDGPVLIFTFAACLTFPTGRLRTRIDKVLLGLTVVALTVFYAPRLLIVPQVQGGGPLAQCVPDCPANPLFISDQPALATAIDRTRTYLALAIAVAIFVLFAARLARSSRPTRRTWLAVGATSLLYLPAFAVFHTARAILQVDRETLETIGWVLVPMRLLFPLGFLAALFQAELFAGRAHRRLLAQLTRGTTPERWRAVLAEALGDPSLRLGYWDPSSGRYRQADGAALDPPPAGSGRAWTLIDRHAQPVAALSTDAIVADDPGLLRAAENATLVAVEQGHLESELRASMTRLVEAGDAERRRIQRDLHDSAQQRLIALRIHLGLARETLASAPEGRAVVEQLGDEVDDVLDELRDIAHGIYPALLAQRGVPEALRAAVRMSAVRARIVDEGFGRRGAPVEHAVYFCCLEAVQNAAKHAGPGASVTVRLAGTDEGVRFAVDDDGVGFDRERVDGGDGLRNIADRVKGVGGTVRVVSVPGRGTRIAARIPA